MSGPLSASASDAARPRLTNKTLFVIAAMNLIDCINVNIMTPYAVEMVSTFLNKNPDSSDVHTTVSLLIGLYSLFEVIFSPFWGMVADRVGRRPCLLIGLAGSALAPILLGLGKSLPVIFAARALDGFFCGNLGVTRTYLGEVVDKTNEARGFSILALCFAMGLIVGPLLGGQLVFPARTAPSLFKGTLFDEYPFLLPNLTYAIFAAIAWIIGFFCMEETLPRSKRCVRTASARHGMQLALSEAVDAADGGDSADAGRTGSKCYPMTTIQVIVTYCGLAGTAVAQNSLVILLLPDPRSLDGFNMGPQQISIILNIGALGVILCFLLNSLAYGLYPVYGLFADPVKYGLWRYVVLGLGQFVYMVGTFLMFPTAFAFINRASEGSWTATQAIAPSFASHLLDGCTGWGWFGRYIPFYIITLVCGLFFTVSWSGLRKIDQATTLPASAGGEEGSSA